MKMINFKTLIGWRQLFNCKSLTPEVQLHHLKVRDPDGGLGDALLVVVVPLAPQPLGLIPHLNQVLVVLDHDVVLVELPVHIRLGSALQFD